MVTGGNIICRSMQSHMPVSKFRCSYDLEGLMLCLYVYKQIYNYKFMKNIEDMQIHA